jgi:putative transcriptional regulator
LTSIIAVKASLLGGMLFSSTDKEELYVMTVPEKVLAGIQDALVHHSTGKTGGRVFSVKTRSGNDLKILRSERLKMTQKEFALQFGIPIRTLQKWEQGEREPEGPARAYLRVIERIPEAVIAALKVENAETVVEM